MFRRRPETLPRRLAHVVSPLDRSSLAPVFCAARVWPFSGLWTLGSDEGLDRSRGDEGYSFCSGSSGQVRDILVDKVMPLV